MPRSRMLLPVLLSLFAVAQAVPPKEATLQFTVLDSNGKPVRNAEVVLHPVDKKGKQKDQGGFELKTHEDGRAVVNGVPYGRVRVQVIAPGFKTYGVDYAVDQPAHQLTIKLQKPAEQHSIYK